MKPKPNRRLKTSAAALLLATVVAGCAAPQQGRMFTATSDAIRAAETAGAVEYAPAQFQQAKNTYHKAEAMNQKRRTDRAQILLQLATAQADLARVTSEAAQAEHSLEYIRTGSIR